jgi:hypothetical protein
LEDDTMEDDDQGESQDFLTKELVCPSCTLFSHPFISYSLNSKTRPLPAEPTVAGSDENPSCQWTQTSCLSFLDTRVWKISCLPRKRIKLLLPPLLLNKLHLETFFSQFFLKMATTVDIQSDKCPVCLNDKYLNHNLKLLVSPCFHKVLFLS